MTAQVESVAPVKSKHAPRKLRNFLLEPRFQLKYTSMVVGVTVVVAAILGYFAYRYSTGQTQMLTMNKVVGETDAALIEYLLRQGESEDRLVLQAILAGIVGMALALGVTGIVVTHKLVGPAYKIRRLLGDVADGHLRTAGRLRKGDELQAVFEAFERMVTKLRESREAEATTLNEAIARLQGAGCSDEALATLRELERKVRKNLE
jgi:nitrogen fixation/metabolism regulation signal transduction histidine kinase